VRAAAAEAQETKAAAEMAKQVKIAALVLIQHLLVLVVFLVAKAVRPERLVLDQMGPQLAAEVAVLDSKGLAVAREELAAGMY
jgi:hypothetical protein